MKTTSHIQDPLPLAPGTLGRAALPLAALLIGGGLTGCVDPCLESGTVCSLVGTGAPGASETETRATEAPLYGPMDVAFWPGQDEYSFFIGDWNNHKIRLVHDGVMSVAIGTTFLGDGDPDFQERIAPGVPGTEVALNHPTQIEWNPVNGKLLVPSWHNHRVREWTPETGNSLVVCANTAIDDGNGANAGFAGDGGPAAEALFAFPNSIAIDPADGSFWVLDARNLRVRKVAADYSLIETVAGTGQPGLTGDGADPLDATFSFWPLSDLQPEPAGALEYDGADRLYVADTNNHVIRVIDLAANTIQTLPGTGEQTLPGGVCDPDALCRPRDVELGPDGLLYIADEGNHVIRAYDLAAGTMDAVVGTFSPGDAADGTPALEAALNRPHGIDLDDDGALLIADTYNHRIRRVTP
jgi:DNA-binding beta-propeller fold protein YncE